MRFKVVVATYNVPDWIQRCLKSISQQDDPAFDVCVVDDGSPPETGQPTFIQTFCDSQGWQYALNERRVGGPLPNQIAALERLGGDPTDVAVFIDGDDWLPDGQVLARLRCAYADPDVWVAYGTQRNEPYSATTNVARPYPSEAWEHPRSVRGWTAVNGIHFNHIRTFRYALFQRMDRDQWHWPSGEWFTANGDSVLFVPALEMAGHARTRHMSEINYVYTPDHPQSEWSSRSRDCNPQFFAYAHYEVLEEL